ncbi:MAG: hypothetical protein E7675_01595 [Ruminococcaceae bacterium]|nr:hypothetical protein [Oscillospiraceae bacterium]
MKKNNKGFSLIDVVCATAIIALVALPICSGFLTAAKSNQRIQTRTETYNMLNNELSLILASGKIELDGNITIDLGTVEFREEPLRPFYKDSNNESEALPETAQKNMASGELVKISLTPKQAIADSTKVAYIGVEISYDDPETAETDDYKVSGVWTE